MRFYEIKFPAFKIADDVKPYSLGTALLVDKADNTTQILDDTAVPGESLGQRRLYISMHQPKAPLFKLSQPIYSIRDLLLIKHRNFIDSAGKVFKYYKSNSGTVESYLIESIEPRNGAFILTCKNLHCKFVLYSAPEIGTKYAEIIRVDLGFILYNLSSVCVKPYKVRL